MFDLNPLGPILEIGGKIIDKIWPDKDAADRAKLELIKLQQSGELAELEKRFSAIVAEATSNDPWTSRARPSFMYVIYILLLSSLPFAVGFMIWPENALRVVDGFKAWLGAIPTELYTLFGVGYVGYGAMRSYDKGAQK